MPCREPNDLRLIGRKRKTPIVHMVLTVSFAFVQVLIGALENTENFERDVDQYIWQTVN